ncbi:MAG: amidase [Burkholderiaceae bacterium]|nr:amidase [Burkholderiaceae bacterium]
MRHDEYLAHDACALAARVAAGDVSAGELLDLALAQLARVQPHINAVVRSLEPQARAQLAGRLSGPLAGVPLLIKDSVQDYAGTPTGYGSRALRANTATEHSAIVRRLLGAGAVIFGKTNLPELGLKGVTDPLAHGRASNPWDLSRTPGGSSGGSAAAVAAGVLPMATGNDGGGSIRIPAACCGLFGLKPSRGRVSVGPGLNELWFGLSQDGVISRSVRDSALALDLLAGPEPGDPFTIAPPAAPFAELARRAPAPLRIGFTTASPLGTPVHAEAAAAVRRSAEGLAGLGHRVDEAQPAIDGAALARSYLHVYFGQIPATLDQALARGAREADFEPLTRIMASLGRSLPASRLTAELMAANTYARALGRFFQAHDLLLTPTLACPPVPHGHGDPPPAQLRLLQGLRRLGLLGALGRLGLLDRAIDDILRDNMSAVPFTQLANLTGVPAMSVPLHWTADGLPLGVQFVAPFGAEATLLQLAGQLEAAQPWFDRVSPLAAAGA